MNQAAFLKKGTESIFSSVRYLKGVGPKKEAVFNYLGISTAKDLLYYFPFRYQDRSNFKTIAALAPDEPSMIKVKVRVAKLRKIPRAFSRTRRVSSVYEVTVSDDTGQAKCVWFNQAFLADMLAIDKEVIIFGRPQGVRGSFKFNSPEYELINGTDSLSMGRIVGVYKLPPPLNQKFIRKTMAVALSLYKKGLSDPLPFYVRKKKNILNIAESLEEIHFPTSWEKIDCARQRFIFEELFFSQVLVYLRKARHRCQPGIVMDCPKAIVEKIKKNFSFELTASQNNTLSTIITDMKKPYPMHRLLQGDVGCGKTVIAALACGIAANEGFQSAFMVPTEVLAHQHLETLNAAYKGLGFQLAVLTSSVPKPQAINIRKRLLSGEIDIVVGTHSLIREEARYKKLGFVVIDEQHKFGVAQRALLPRKGELNPHCLVMSATPIPRSLALSLYGDLDLSVIDEMPKARTPAQTLWVDEAKRGEVYSLLRDKLNQGRQAYIVYPLIEENEDAQLKSLEASFKAISKEFSPFTAAMFHGKMNIKDKLAVIRAFKSGKVDILVATTVVEVGVDIPNATAMVVENPERFGLAQLHQLRGRIQRWSHQPHFILLSRKNLSFTALKRLEVISRTNNGFEIAEEDLLLRGPGDFFGRLQHGIPALKIANPLRDIEILEASRALAYDAIKNDPSLGQIRHRCIRKHLDFWFRGQESFSI